ncbi:CotH kinase family protein [Crocinitomix catalasitica]|nr:CotH kinase family protein [Crocinitomix catalasitica]
MGIIDNGPGMINYITDPFNGYNDYISIEIRGSTSQQYPKKNYGLTTQDYLENSQNVSLLGMPPEDDWILYAPYPDKTCIRNALTFDLARKMDNYATAYRYCELVIDGNYRGLYMLMEKIKVHVHRVDISHIDSTTTTGDSLTGGYIVKVDKPTGSAFESWPSLYDPEVIWQYHDPKPNKMHLIQKSYIQSYIGDFETTIFGADFADPELGYHKLINKVSFYDQMILNELGRTVDGYRSSSFFYKNKESIWGGYLNAGPAWDFNLSYGNANYCDADLTTGWQYEFDDICDFTVEIPFFWERLLDDPDYVDGLRCRWEMLRAGPLHTDSIDAFIDQTASYIEEARIRNFVRWPIIGVYVNWNSFVGPTYDSEINYMKSYIQARAIWLDANIPGNCYPGLSAIEEEEFDDPKSRAWPNPFNEYLFLGYTLDQAADVRILISDLSGKIAAQFNLGPQNPGHYVKEWQNFLLEKGVYIYSIYTDGELLDQDKIVHL